MSPELFWLLYLSMCKGGGVSWWGTWAVASNQGADLVALRFVKALKAGVV